MKFRSTALMAVLVAAALMVPSNGVASGTGAHHHSKNIVLVYNGPAITNTHAAPRSSAFTSWCDSECVPSVTMPAIDAATGKVEGQIYVWTKNLDLTPGAPLAFGEFIWFALKGGSIYVDSGENGTVGAIMDPAVKPPTHINGDAGAVVGGGGDGDIVGGTGKYKRLKGTYTDRVFVELNFAGGANFYDQLFFSINPA